MLRILHDTHYDFIRWWRHAVVITVLFILGGLGSLALTGINYSIEFTGGTLMQVVFVTPPNVSDVRNPLDLGGVHGAEIQQSGTNREYTILETAARTEADPDNAPPG
mgnify:CR=1 FL=1